MSLQEGDAVVVGVDRASLMGDITGNMCAAATVTDSGGMSSGCVGGAHRGPLLKIPARGGGPLGICS